MLADAEAVRFGDFLLASGRRSNVYVDVKRAWTDPKRLGELARAFAKRVRPQESLAGVELGAVPLVVATALATGRPYVIIRKQAKEHGTRLPFEGEVGAGARFLILEDVTTSGGSVVRSVELLRSAGATVDRAVVVVDREEGAREKLRSVGVELEALATLDDVRRVRP
ncbi:MAG TPA: orotate phosphoribosyltransferase [Thermoplasmata archaeon]|nr:orotate phosphoribosyltransferase [Thermoplasmata archaeon]